MPWSPSLLLDCRLGCRVSGSLLDFASVAVGRWRSSDILRIYTVDLWRSEMTIGIVVIGEKTWLTKPGERKIYPH